MYGKTSGKTEQERHTVYFEINGGIYSPIPFADIRYYRSAIQIFIKEEIAMSALDGKITIEKELRPCIATIRGTGMNLNGEMFEDIYEFKALFHCWHPVTGNAVVEREEGAIQEVKPPQIRFVDNVMSEYVFPEMEENTK